MKIAIRRLSAPCAFAVLFAAAACFSRGAPPPDRSAPDGARAGSHPIGTTGGEHGMWERHGQRAFNRSDRFVRLAAGGSAALPDFELVRNGEVIGRVATRGSGSPGSARTPRRVLTLYRDGTVARTFDLPLVERPSERSVGAGSSPPVFRAVAAPGGATIFASGGSGSCDAQFESMFDAIDRYWAADAAFGECFSSSSGCLGAVVGLADSWRGIVEAAGSLGACLAVT